MKRSLSRASAGAVALGVLLSGCAAAPVADPDEVQEWLAQQGAEDDEDAALLARLDGLAAREPSESADGPGSGIKIDFAAPVRVDDLTFSCFGVESMSVQFWMSGPQGAESRAVDDLRCDEGPHVLTDGGVSVEPVTAVTANGSQPDGSGAWSLVVHGAE